MVNRLKLKFLLLFISWALLANVSLAQDAPPKKQEDTKSTSISEQIKKFTQRKVDQQKYVLKYKFKKGDVIRWKHDHQTLVETRFAKASDKTSTRARPEYKWTVENIDSRGTIRFDIEMERIKVLEQQGEADPIHYDSDKHKEVPVSCMAYKERLGRVCSTYSISPTGQVVNHKSHYNQMKLGGVGNNPVIAFPDKAMPIGHKWDVPSTVRAKDEFGILKQVELRVRYVLDKVVDGRAHITFTTSLLNPNVDETVRSQIVTHMTRGFIVFDIAQGVITNRETRWDERVIGYQGAESYMHYTAFRKEALVQEAKVAAEKKPAARIAKKETSTETKLEQTHTSLLQPLQPMKKVADKNAADKNAADKK